MTTAKHDRRAERSRHLLRSALTALLQERRYDDITVQDISDRANVGRSSFYAHFTDKDDLLAHAFEWVLEMLTQDLGGQTQDGQIITSTALFAHIQRQPVFYHALARSRGMDRHLHTGQARVSVMVAARLAAYVVPGQEPRVPLPVIAQSVAGTLFVLLTWWLDHHMPYTPQQMDDMFQQLVMPGVWAALGTRSS